MAESAEKIADCTGGMKVLITLAAKRNVGHFFVSMNGENGKMREQDGIRGPLPMKALKWTR